MVVKVVIFDFRFLFHSVCYFLLFVEVMERGAFVTTNVNSFLAIFLLFFDINQGMRQQHNSQKEIVQEGCF